MMEYLDLETLLAGVFYLTLGLWWFVSIATKYTSCVRACTDFSSKVAYPCCGVLNKLPVEGAFKLLSGSLIAILSAIKCYSDCDENRKLGEVTIFFLFAVSGFCDMLYQKCQRYVFISIDYFILMFVFLVQTIVSACHPELTSSLAVADNCMMYVAATATLAVLLEFRYTEVVWYSIMRSFSTCVLGTWNFHVALSLDADREAEISSISNVTVSSEGLIGALSNYTQNVTATIIVQESQNIKNDDYLLLVPMYFAWHCFIDMVVLTVLWFIVNKCSSKGICRCFCSIYEEETETHFQHHVHFDYHIIERLDSDLE